MWTLSASRILTAHPVSPDTFTTYSFTSVSFGSASGTRRIVVGVTGGTDTDALLSSATIGGVAATIVQNVAAGSGSTRANAALLIADVPTGTSGTIAITWNAEMRRCGLGVWAVYNLQSSVPVASGNSTGDPGSTSINTSSGGVAIACAYSRVTNSVTWTNLTEDYDEVYAGSRTQSGASAVTGGGSLSITATYANSTVAAMVAGSWR